MEHCLILSVPFVVKMAVLLDRRCRRVNVDAMFSSRMGKFLVRVSNLAQPAPCVLNYASVSVTSEFSRSHNRWKRIGALKIPRMQSTMNPLFGRIRIKASFVPC